MDLLAFEPKPDWYERGACHGVPSFVSLFYPDDEGGNVSGGEISAVYDKARAICLQCPVRKECLSYAIQNREIFGMWGGLSPRERHRYKRNPEAFLAGKKTCERCGAILKGKQKDFCGQNCVKRASTARRTLHSTGDAMGDVGCVLCGTVFRQRSPNHKFCSGRCARKGQGLTIKKNVA